jgi:hypothetical protein
MKKNYSNNKRLSVALCILAVTAAAVLAQGGSRGTPSTSVERREDLSNRQATEYEIESSSRELKKPHETAADRKRAQGVAEQIKHDFGGLQESHNQIVLFMANKEGLNGNYDSVLRAVVEIKKYAARLKTNLALPKPQQGKDGVGTNYEDNDEQLANPLMTLRKHIYNFVTNPLFATAGVLDLEQGSKAARDLDRIIELSGNISKSMDKRKQSAKP